MHKPIAALVASTLVLLAGGCVVGEDEYAVGTAPAVCESGGGYADFAHPLMERECLACHSAALEGAARLGAPAGIDFDTEADLRRHSDRIRVRTVDEATMPPNAPISSCDRQRLDAYLDQLDAGPCEPSCTGRTCGDDGCGGSCGTCEAGQACNAAGACVDTNCTPDCGGAVCGDDGCGGTCGTCTAPESCGEDRQCRCEPSCDGRSCGDDGCGGTCGSCPTGQTCDDAGACSCVPDCAGRACGPDGCGGSCGTCQGSLVCDTREGACVTSCTPDCDGRICGDDGCGGSCGSCAGGQACTAEGACVCEPDCVGKACGDDGCGGTCGTCSGNASCSEAGQCECVPDCSGRTCGSDGCGGLCGTCQAGQSCDAGTCGWPNRTFSGDVWPIFQAKGCANNGCHSGNRPSEDLDLSTASRAWSELVGVTSGQCGTLVISGDPANSYLVAKLTGVGMCSGNQMPSGSGTPLSSTQIDAVRAWIANGALNN